MKVKCHNLYTARTFRLIDSIICREHQTKCADLHVHLHRHNITPQSFDILKKWWQLEEQYVYSAKVRASTIKYALHKEFCLIDNLKYKLSAAKDGFILHWKQN